MNQLPGSPGFLVLHLARRKAEEFQMYAQTALSMELDEAFIINCFNEEEDLSFAELLDRIVPDNHVHQYAVHTQLERLARVRRSSKVKVVVAAPEVLHTPHRAQDEACQELSPSDIADRVNALGTEPLFEQCAQRVKDLCITEGTLRDHTIEDHESLVDDVMTQPGYLKCLLGGLGAAYECYEEILCERYCGPRQLRQATVATLSEMGLKVVHARRVVQAVDKDTKRDVLCRLFSDIVLA